MKLMLLGPPGAGKGTQAAVLSRHYGIAHISTGDMLRDALRQKTHSGLAAKAVMERGELVTDEIITQIVRERLQKPDVAGGYILDGFPRTIQQAESIDEKFDAVLYFKTSSEVAVERLSGRRVCSGCGANYHIKNMPPKKPAVCDRCGGGLIQRKDDNRETIEKRLEVYERQTAPVVDFYRAKGNLIEANGDLEVKEAFKQITALLSGKK